MDSIAASTFIPRKMTPDEALQLVEAQLNSNSKMNDNERDLFRGIWQRQSYQEIYNTHFRDRCQLPHMRSNIANGLWRKLRPVLGDGVNKKTLRSHVERAQLNWSQLPPSEGSLPGPEDQSTYLQPPGPGVIFSRQDTDSAQNSSAQNHSIPDSPIAAPFEPQDNRQVSWSDSPDVTGFCGRGGPLQSSEQRIRVERCRLLAITGEAGMGKTWFAKQLALNVKDFYGDRIAWRSFNQGPLLPLSALLAELLQTLSGSPWPGAISLDTFIEFLMNSPCLIILDQFEALLQTAVHDGTYLEGYKDYSQFLTQVGQRPHQSCLLLTSREQPQEVISLTDGRLVSDLSLPGFEVLEVEEMLHPQSQGQVPPGTWRRLTQHCGGNPLALRETASLIRSLGGWENIESFFDYAKVVDKVIQLQQVQFQRLSALEQEILLRICQQPEPTLTFKSVDWKCTLPGERGLSPGGPALAPAAIAPVQEPQPGRPPPHHALDASIHSPRNIQPRRLKPPWNQPSIPGLPRRSPELSQVRASVMHNL
ncbi:MAG: hypothetical protein HC824_13960 [Synechococcales cyanobacterium RM1_1_8]|nr:hypothetical protein [Synechococcales cyanobacterium RM1_1_8]